MTHLANIDKDYAFWIERLSQRYKQSQIKAATHVNSEMLQFYWSLGRDIVMLHAESRWGDKFVKTLSADLRAKLPGVKGLSETSIGYAKRFYLLYSKCCVIHPQLGGESGNDMTEPAFAPHAVAEFQDLTSSTRTPKFICEQWSDTLMPFHKHSPIDSLLTLRQCHLYCHDGPGKSEHLVHTHIYA